MDPRYSLLLSTGCPEKKLTVTFLVYIGGKCNEVWNIFNKQLIHTLLKWPVLISYGKSAFLTFLSIVSVGSLLLCVLLCISLWACVLLITKPHLTGISCRVQNSNVIHSIEMRCFCARPQMEIWQKILVGVIFFWFWDFCIFTTVYVF